LTVRDPQLVRDQKEFWNHYNIGSTELVLTCVQVTWHMTFGFKRRV